MGARPAVFLLVVCACGYAGQAEEPPPTVDVIPQPRHVTLVQGEFAVDRYCVVLVSEKATRGTRRAARAIQLGIRERLGLDVPVMRIAEQTRRSPTRPIWVVEPRLRRRPAKTIGAQGLKFSGKLLDGGYFIRVDAVEAVIHGANDAGSYHGAQTLLQLIRPGRKGGLLRKSGPPTIPCLWIKDWPSQPVRVIPSPFGPHEDTSIGVGGSERLIELGAHYKLNALPKALLAADPGFGDRLRALAAWRGISIIDEAPRDADSPLLTALIGDAADPLRLRLAAQAEAAWGPPDPDAETFRRRLAVDAANYPMRAMPPPRPVPKRDLLEDDEAEKEGQD